MIVEPDLQNVGVPAKRDATINHKLQHYNSTKAGSKIYFPYTKTLIQPVFEHYFFIVKTRKPHSVVFRIPPKFRAKIFLNKSCAQQLAGWENNFKFVDRC